MNGPTMTTQPLNPARVRLAATRRNLALWTFQGWLAMFFTAAGYAKLTQPMDVLTMMLLWPAFAPANLVRGLGVAEIVLAAMVLAPLVSWRIGRCFLVAAAGGLLALETVMLGVHLTGGAFGLAAVNTVLIGITVPVLWMRARESR